MELLALAVGITDLPGESFVLTQESAADGRARVTVIDVGAKGRRGKASVGQRAATYSPDVVVLTHSDADHIGGWSKFQEQLAVETSTRVPEYWLPVDWALIAQCVVSALVPSLLQDHERPATLLAPPDAVTSANIDAAGEEARLYASQPCNRLARGREGPCVDCRRRVQQQLTQGLAELQVASHAQEEDVRKRVRDLVSQIVDLARPIFDADTVSENRLGAVYPDDDDELSDALDESTAKEKLEAVLIILLDTLPDGNVRWFSPDVPKDGEPAFWLRQGDPGVLTTINAREVPGPVRWNLAPDGAAALALFLTVANRRALAIFAWQGHDDSIPHVQPTGKGVLLTSDSARPHTGPSAWSPSVPWSHIGLMTATHHGSNNVEHEGYWSDPAREEGLPTLLSNNRHNKNKQVAFYATPSTSRACTFCLYASKPAKPADRRALLEATGRWRINDSCFTVTDCSNR